MYTTCLFCNRDLGSNEVVENFPVGRRLAFDSARGRLWVVCRRCERWNLTPIEERWEAVEECERLFRATRVRSSTENVGLAKLGEGLELVRIGAPLRPEFAAWRYGDQFGRRRKRAILYGTAGVVVIGGVAIGGMVTGVLSGAVLGQSGNLVNAWQNGRTRMKLRVDGGRVLKLKNPDLKRTQLLTPDDADGGFGVVVTKKKEEYVLTGDRGRRAAGQIMTKINSAGAKRDAVQLAVREIEDSGHPEALIDLASKKRTWDARKKRKKKRKRKGPDYGMVAHLPTPTRLALEMALHEEEERRALEGELWLLEEAWREAEEIAAISDNLLLPEDVGTFLEEHDAGVTTPSPAPTDSNGPGRT